MDLFIDRCQERKQLLHTIQEQHINSHVLLLAAASGIGKTRLVDYVINESGYKIPYRVRISKGESTETTDGLYFKKLLLLISKNAEKYWKLQSFPQFFQMRDTPGIALRMGINCILPAVGQEINQIKNSVNEVESWLGDNSFYFNLAKEYVIKILNSLSSQVIFAIENFQGIDSYSIEILMDVLTHTNNVLLISEYTCDSEGVPVKKLCNIFQKKNIEINAYSLDKLPKHEILKVLSNNRLYDMVSTSYDESNGNLFKLSLLWNRNDVGLQSLTFQNSLKSTLERLTKPEKIILSSIELHQGQMLCSELERLDQIVPSLAKESKSVKNNLDFLCREGLLKIRERSYVLAHDSLVSEIRMHTQFKQANLISIHAWIDYYQQITNSLELTDEQRLYCDKQILLMAIRNQDYTVFVQELEKINQSLQVYPIASLVLFLTALIKQYENDKKNSDWDAVVYRWCIFIYYQCGQFKHVLDFDIDVVKHLDDVAKTCYLAALSSEDPVRAECLLGSWYKKSRNAQINLALSLIKIRMFRAKGEIQKYKNLWRKLDKDSSYYHSLLKADICRYVSLCETSDYDLRISKQKQAFNLYRKQNRIYGQIASSLIISRDLCFLRQLKESEKWLETAKKLMTTTLYPRHQYYNNIGLLQLFNKSYDLALSNFNRALEICTNSDDIILIESNKLSAYILNNIFSDASDELFRRLFQEYLKCNNITTNELLYNCYNYANQRQFQIEKHQLQQPYEKLVFEINTPKSELHYQSNILNHVMGKCLPVFVIDWDVDYYNVLGNS